MVQTVKSLKLVAGDMKIVFEKPHILRRIFVRIVSVLPRNEAYKSHISFDDPMFYTYYILLGSTIHFEVKGEGIFQGDIWVRNESTISITYSLTEILV